jgi:DNA topoisomerase-1
MRLYELIWKRTVACQMKDAKGERTQLRLSAEVGAGSVQSASGEQLSGTATLTASGKVITFAGYLRAYQNGKQQGEESEERERKDDRERLLPPLAVGDAVAPLEVEAREHTTQPPSRFTEAALVKVLEERGIGRPSTYATIIQTIQDRGYVWKQGNTLVPTLTAFAVVNLLERHFGDLVDYEFTARMESDLDDISSGDTEATPWLERFYFGKNGKKAHAEDKIINGTSATLTKVGLKGLIGSGVEHIDARDICSIDVGKTPEGDLIAARVGRYGPYLQVADSERRANIADDVVLDELDAEHALELLKQADLANRPLGIDPKTEKNVYIKSGSFGPYVQLGEPELTPKGNIKKGGKPKMASIWPGMSVETITLEQALLLLSFPRELGQHPETKSMITAQDGKFGPYIQMELPEDKRETRSLENHEQLRSIDLAGALELLSKPRVSRRGQRNAPQAPLAELGDSPVTGSKIEVRSGRFGPYVTDGQVNATIPSNRDPQKITFDDALELIAAREQRMRDQGKDPRAPKPARKKAAAKKTGVKKSAKKTTKKATRKKATKKKVVAKKASGDAAGA